MLRRKLTYRLLTAMCCWLLAVGAPCSAWAFDREVRYTAAPAYQFQSTSSYNSVVGTSAYTPMVSAPFSGTTPMNAPRKTSGSPWDPWGGDGSGDPDGEEIGVAHVVPVGDTPWLLIGMLLIAFLCTKKRKDFRFLFAQLKKKQ